MREVAVCGAGVVGLTAAIELQRRSHRATIVARDRAAQSVSAVAAAIWYPYLAEPQDRVRRWSLQTYARLVELARDPSSGVHLQPTIERLGAHSPPPLLATARIADGELHTTVPVCDTRRYLPWLEQQFVAAGGTFVQRTLHHLDDAFDHGDAVVHCTGLGARELCGDDTMLPVRGQVVLATGVQVEHARIDDSGEAPLYVIPRGDQLVLGGTAQRGDTRTEPDPADTDRIVADCRRAVPALAAATLLAAKCGLRPWRPTVRVERERRARGVVVHDYGHGGSGFTIAWGCAAEVADLLDHD